MLTVKKPDGSDWIEARADVAELAEEEGTSVEVALWGEEHEIAEVGECAFTLQAVNEMEGVDEKLHEGAFTVKKVSDENLDVGVPLDWMLPLGLVAIDVHSDKDGPPLRATVFLGGDVQSHEIEAHLFHGKERVATRGRPLARPQPGRLRDPRGASEEAGAHHRLRHRRQRHARFDDDGNTIDEWEEQGTGSSSPRAPTSTTRTPAGSRRRRRSQPRGSEG